MHGVRRFVAIGDSLTEGLGDPLPSGGHRGWADLLAAMLAAQEPRLEYANLALRGLTVPAVRRSQVGQAIALRPDLVAAAVGMNDLVQPRLDLVAFEIHVDALFRDLTATGGRVLTVTPPDVSRVIPLARIVRQRALRMREIVLERGAAHGAEVLDLWAEPAATDPRSWAPNRLHPSAHGHLLLAQLAARRLGLDVPLLPNGELAVGDWSQLAWVWSEVIPWLVRHYRGRSPADGRSPKRPLLGPLTTDGTMGA